MMTMAEIGVAECLGDFGLWKDEGALTTFDYGSSEDISSEYDSDAPLDFSGEHIPP